jgi:hypothetical protein
VIMATKDEEGGGFISKNWIIGIMVIIIGGLCSLAIVQHLNANEKTSDAVIQIQLDIASMKSDVNYIKFGVADMNSKVNNIIKLKETP